MDSDTAIYRVALGPVMQAKLPPGDPRWPEFNGSFVNKDLPGLDIAARLYDGHPITTWHKNHWRQSCNYQMGQHLGIDFDTNDERSSLPHLLKDPFIKKYGAIVYTTPSHTPAAPRARAIFLLDTPIHQAVNYSLAATSASVGVRLSGSPVQRRSSFLTTAGGLGLAKWSGSAMSYRLQ